MKTITLLLSILALLFAVPAPKAEDNFTLVKVADGVYAAVAKPGGLASGNAGFVVGDDGVLMVDTFFTPAAVEDLIATIANETKQPLKYALNTHYHLDHTGGDQALRDAGAVIIAHRNVRGWVRTENVHLLGPQITAEFKAQIAALPLPDVTTDKDLTVWLGSRKIVVRTVLGHTGGDLTVFVPDSKVLFTGDMLWRKIPPNLIDGSVKEWTATDADFEHMPDAAHTIFVPGHGDVANLKDVDDFRAYLLDLRRLVTDGRKAGLKGDALAQAVTPKLKALHPDWTISDRAAAAEIRYMNDELAGTKRRPIPDHPD